MVIVVRYLLGLVAVLLVAMATLVGYTFGGLGLSAIMGVVVLVGLAIVLLPNRNPPSC